MLTEIRQTCVRICNRFKNSSKKQNKELQELINFVSKSDLFKGKKRKTKKLIRSFMIIIKVDKK